MKKTRFLALVLVVSIMMMGAGYAFWTEALAINGTVNTGELNFEFNNEGFIPVGIYVGGSAAVVNDGHTLNLDFINMHPGSTANVKFCIENTGSIGLKIDNFEYEGDSEYLNQMYVMYDGNEMTIPEFFLQLQTLELGLDGKICVDTIFGVKKCADEDNFGEVKDFTFSVTANVKQYNDDGSCVEIEEPDPAVCSRVFKGSIVDKNGNTYKGTEVEEDEIGLQTFTPKYYIKGTVTTSYDIGPDEIVNVYEPINYLQAQETVSGVGYTLEFKITWSKYFLTNLYYPSDLKLVN